MWKINGFFAGYEWMKNGTSMDNGNRKMEDQWILPSGYLT